MPNDKEHTLAKKLRQAGWTRKSIRQLLRVPCAKISIYLQHPEHFSILQIISIAGLIGEPFEDVLFDVLKNWRKRKAMNERWYQVSEEVKPS